MGGWETLDSRLRLTCKVIASQSAQVHGDAAVVIDGTVGELFRMEEDLAGRFLRALGREVLRPAVLYREAQSLNARKLFGEGLEALRSAHKSQQSDSKEDALRDVGAAIDFLRKAQETNEGVFFARAHHYEATARELRARCQKDEEAVQAVRVETIRQFRRDAGKAAPAFFDLGRALEANQEYAEALQAYGETLRWIADEARQVKWEVRVKPVHFWGPISADMWPVKYDTLYYLVVSGGRFVVLEERGTELYAVCFSEQTGDEIWRSSLGRRAERRSVACTETELLAFVDDRLVVIRLTDGKQVSKVALPSYVPPVMTEGTTHRGNGRCLASSTSPEIVVLERGQTSGHVGSRATKSQVLVVDWKKGSVLWQLDWPDRQEGDNRGGCEFQVWNDALLFPVGMTAGRPNYKPLNDFLDGRGWILDLKTGKSAQDRFPKEWLCSDSFIRAVYGSRTAPRKAIAVLHDRSSRRTKWRWVTQAVDGRVRDEGAVLNSVLLPRSDLLTHRRYLITPKGGRSPEESGVSIMWDRKNLEFRPVLLQQGAIELLRKTVAYFGPKGGKQRYAYDVALCGDRLWFLKDPVRREYAVHDLSGALLNTYISDPRARYWHLTKKNHHVSMQRPIGRGKQVTVACRVPLSVSRHFVTSARVHLRMSRCYRLLKQLTEALHHALAAVQEDRTCAEANYEAAVSYLQLEKRTEAANAYFAACEAAPSGSALWLKANRGVRSLLPYTFRLKEWLDSIPNGTEAMKDSGVTTKLLPKLNRLLVRVKGRKVRTFLVDLQSGDTVWKLPFRVDLVNYGFASVFDGGKVVVPAGNSVAWVVDLSRGAVLPPRDFSVPADARFPFSGVRFKQAGEGALSQGVLLWYRNTTETSNSLNRMRDVVEVLATCVKTGRLLWRYTPSMKLGETVGGNAFWVDGCLVLVGGEKGEDGQLCVVDGSTGKERSKLVLPEKPEREGGFYPPAGISVYGGAWNGLVKLNDSRSRYHLFDPRSCSWHVWNHALRAIEPRAGLRGMVRATVMKTPGAYEREYCRWRTDLSSVSMSPPLLYKGWVIARDGKRVRRTVEMYGCGLPTPTHSCLVTYRGYEGQPHTSPDVIAFDKVAYMRFFGLDQEGNRVASQP
jgi:tetratricopeptide (TPR) repeat protein